MRTVTAWPAMLLALVLLPAAARGQAGSYEEASKGFYFDLRGGAAFLEDSDVSGISGIDVDYQFDPGIVVEGAAGYEHSSGVRGEIALGWRRNDIEDITLSADGVTISVADILSGVSIDLGGDVDAVSLMANLYYAFDVGGRVRPFIGAGAGAAFLSGELELTSGGTSVSADADDTVLAYQGMAGLEYDIPVDWGGLALGLRYAYFATEDPEIAPGIEAEYSSHAVMVGVRISR